jgi:site-specific DNA-methyltransferase (adenine-specific)
LQLAEVADFVTANFQLKINMMRKINMNEPQNPPFLQTAVMCLAVDNLELLKSQSDESVDFIYCDILYGTGRNFGEYQDLKPIRSEIESHYLPRIIEMKRVLKNTGSIYLQMDTRINHWMRIMLDDIFCYKNFQNEIVWIYRTQGFSSKKWSEKHDVILFYSKSKNFKFNLESVREKEIGESTQKRWHKEIAEHGMIPTKKNSKIYWNSPYSPPRDWIDMNALPQAHFERNGYPTQKPKELIRRFIVASTNEGDTVADYYLGSGTTAVVCKELNRKFIGCDINPNAIEITKSRLDAVS